MADHDVFEDKVYVMPDKTALFRLYNRNYRATQFNDSDKGSNRFSPIIIKDGEHESVISVLYAAESHFVCMGETIMRQNFEGAHTLSDIGQLGDYNVALLELKRELTLLDLNQIGQIEGLLMAGVESYPKLKRFAAVIANLDRFDGMCWNSYQLGYAGVKAMVLFGNRCKEYDFDVRSSRELLYPSEFGRLEQAARDLRVLIPEAVKDLAAHFAKENKSDE